ncbi:cysteine hydrolase family protein [Photobacterium nomapromontoriensis]|uniref:cysteine hydrolase family protein n=1 Tax=Photobacterium nomapromontoriensis TaxID=2910237 RepID=UPI003D134F0B
MNDTQTALILIDIQNDYFDGGKFPLAKPIAAASNSREILQRFRANKQLVVHVQHDNVDDRKPFLQHGTEGQKIHASVAPAADEIVVTKHFPNSFWQTELDAILKRNNISKITLVGMMTHMCVSATARAAMERGYQIAIVSDACATRELEFEHERLPAETVHKVALSEVAMFSKLMTTASYLAN